MTPNSIYLCFHTIISIYPLSCPVKKWEKSVFNLFSSSTLQEECAKTNNSRNPPHPSIHRTSNCWIFNCVLCSERLPVGQIPLKWNTAQNQSFKDISVCSDGWHYPALWHQVLAIKSIANVTSPHKRNSHFFQTHPSTMTQSQLIHCVSVNQAIVVDQFSRHKHSYLRSSWQWRLRDCSCSFLQPFKVLNGKWHGDMMIMQRRRGTQLRITTDSRSHHCDKYGLCSYKVSTQGQVGARTKNCKRD